MSRQNTLNVRFSDSSKSGMHGRRNTRCVTETPISIIHETHTIWLQEAQEKYKQSKKELDDLVAGMEGI
jgi:hypothetical protein